MAKQRKYQYAAKLPFLCMASDTCSSCHEFLAKMKSLQAQTLTTTGNDLNKVESDIRKQEINNKLHKAKALEFYKRKKCAKAASRSDIT